MQQVWRFIFKELEETASSGSVGTLELWRITLLTQNRIRGKIILILKYYNSF